MMSAKRLYSIKELVTAVVATERFWRTQIWDGQLPYIQVGKKMFIDSQNVERFLQKHKLRPIGFEAWLPHLNTFSTNQVPISYQIKKR